MTRVPDKCLGNRVGLSLPVKGTEDTIEFVEKGNLNSTSQLDKFSQRVAPVWLLSLSFLRQKCQAIGVNRCCPDRHRLTGKIPAP